MEALSNHTNVVEVPAADLPLITPFSCVCAGPSGSGKTSFIFKLLSNLQNITSPPIEDVVYIFSEEQKIFKNFPNIYFTRDLKFLEIAPKRNTLIILDDLMGEVKNNQAIEKAFTKYVHHRGVSVILVLQNLFCRGDVLKTVRDNAHYFYFTEILQDIGKMEIFARQLDPRNVQYFHQSYQDAVKEQYNGLFVDLHPKSKLRRSDLKVKFRSKVYQIVGQVLYIPTDLK